MGTPASVSTSTFGTSRYSSSPFRIIPNCSRAARSWVAGSVSSECARRSIREFGPGPVAREAVEEAVRSVARFSFETGRVLGAYGVGPPAPADAPASHPIS